MPDEAGKLSSEDKKKIIDWLGMKTAEKVLSCAVCGTKDWVLGDHVVTPVGFGTSYNLGGSAYPQAMLICKNCGHTVYLNAMMMGVLEPPKATPTEETK